MKELYIKASSYHSRQFEGNQCHVIMKRIHRLDIPSEFYDYKDTLIALRKLYNICNSVIHNYVKVINDFSCYWYKLTQKHNVSTTPKVHIILE